MKKLSIAAFICSALLTGCGSTNNSAAVDPNFNGHPIDIASTDTYEWDNSKSFALNIAELAKPAGVGYGLNDSDNPKNLEIGRSGNAVVSGALGFLAGGLGGTFGYLSMDSQIDEKRNWRPSVVTFYEEGEIDLSNPVAANKKIRQDVGKKIADAIIAAHPETQYGGTFHYYKKEVNNAVTLLSGDICQEAFEYGRVDDVEYKKQENLHRFKKVIPAGSTNINEACMFVFSTKIAGKVNGKITAVSEINAYNVSTFFINEASNNINEAYILYPDVVQYIAYGSQAKHYKPYPYPAVVGNGKEYLFDANENSTSI